MKTPDQGQKQRWQSVLERTLRRLDERSRLREDDPQPALAATRAYNDLGDRLMAAGYARALGQAEEEVHEHLRAAGEAAIEVFHGQGTTVTEITHLPGMETERFFDDSMINPETFVDGFYALLVGGAGERLGDLREAAEQSGLFDDELAEPDALAVARALAYAASGEPDRWKKAHDVLSTAPRGDGRWGDEARCLELIADAKSVELETCLDEYRDALDRAFATGEHRDTAGHLLGLPILGLKALAAQRGTAGARR